MECTINWQPASGMAFMAETGSGHIINMDGAPEGGGRNLTPRPMETVLAGTGGCTAYDVVLILKRGRHDVRGCQLKLTAERADRPQGVHQDQHAFRGDRRESDRNRRAARDSDVARKILLGLDRDWQNRRDHHQLRDRRGLIGATRPIALRGSAPWSS